MGFQINNVFFYYQEDDEKVIVFDEIGSNSFDDKEYSYDDDEDKSNFVNIIQSSIQSSNPEVITNNYIGEQVEEVKDIIDLQLHSPSKEKSMTNSLQPKHVEITQSNVRRQNDQSTLTDNNNEHRYFSTNILNNVATIDNATTTTNTAAVYSLNENSEIVKLQKELMIREYESIQEMRREKHSLEMELLRCDLEFKKIEHRKKLECLDKKLKE